MSILTDALKCSVSVDGEEIGIKTDFRIWLRFDGILKSKKCFWEKLSEMIMLCLEPNEELPQNAGALFDALLDFYCRGKKPSGGGKHVFDAEADADYIYAAFYEQYGIDLIETPMHWHKFCALLSGLSDDTCLMQIIRIRSMDETGLDVKNRASLRKLKSAYALPKDGGIDAAQVLADAF